MRVKDWSPDDQPREKLLHQGAGSLSNSELLAILLRTGRKGESVVELSRNLLDRFGGLEGLCRVSIDELKTVNGLGNVKAVTIAAAAELALRYQFTKGQLPSAATPEAVYKFLKSQVIDSQQEHFWVLTIDTQMKIKGLDLVTTGLLNSSQVHPREVLFKVIKRMGHAFLVAHNHPSGNQNPSKSDLDVTRSLARAGNAVDIRLLDHLIVTSDSFTSLKRTHPHLFEATHAHN